MKYSKNFERDYDWYLKYKDTFTFSGSPKKEIKIGKLTAKECFYIYDSTGKLEGCSEPKLLQEIFLCKESINFQIKEWAQDRAKGYLPKILFCKETAGKSNNTIEEEYNLLPWMVTAVENQKFKYY